MQENWWPYRDIWMDNAGAKTLKETSYPAYPPKSDPEIQDKDFLRL